MRRRATAIAALLVVLGLTACAMKDAAQSEAPPASPAMVKAVTMEKAAEGGDFAEEQTGEVDDLLGALDGKASSKVRQRVALEDGFADMAPEAPTELMPANEPVAAAPAPPPPPKMVALQERSASMRFDAQNGQDDTVAEANGIGGLGLRGTGRGGGGQGFGRIHGMGQVDTGGGKGYGSGPGAKGKKKRKPSPSKASVAMKPQSRARPKRPARQLMLGESADGDALLVDKERSRIEPADGLFADQDELLEETEEEEKKEERAEKLNRNQAAFAAKDRRGPRGRDKANKWSAARTRAPGGGEFQAMLDPLDSGEVDGRFEVAEYAQRFEPPPRFIPRMCYFENTYLGGNAAYTERLRRLDDALPGGRQPYRAAALPRQPFDAPDDAGLALTATLDRAYVDQPQRVFLQVGLQGSKRFGWRRPPLDIALVVDGSATDGETLVEAITALSRRLGPQDRLGVVLATTQPVVLGELSPLRDRLVLARAIEALGSVPAGPPGALAAAMNRAGGMLQTAAGESTRIPGTQTVLVLTRGADETRIGGARSAAHALTVQGAVTSVIQIGGSHQGWWQVANAGHGNYHRTTDDALAAAVDDELGSISRVIARLLRINVKLADGVEAIRVVGSRVLGQQEVKQVKAREEATDRNLSKTMGVKADRGDDDDGVQTVVPYFYGGDSHVILLELWVTRPGPVAEVTLKYKDMVALQNATTRVAAQLDRVPRDLSPAERRVAANVRGFQLAEGLTAVASYAENGNRQQALDALDALDALAFGRDQRMLDAFASMVQRRGVDTTVAEALRMARDRRIGHSP